MPSSIQLTLRLLWLETKSFTALRLPTDGLQKKLLLDGLGRGTSEPANTRGISIRSQTAQMNMASTRG